MTAAIERLAALSCYPAPRAGRPVGPEALAHVDALLRDWPDGIRQLLLDLHDGRDRRWRLAKLPARDHDGTPVAMLAEQVERVLSDGLGTDRRRRAPGLAARFSAAEPLEHASTPISHTAAMERLEGRPRERLARWWVEAGILHERAGPKGRATLSAEEVSGTAMLLRTIADARPRPRNAVDISFIDRSVANGVHYGKDDFLRDLLAGRIAAWPRSRGSASSLAGLLFDRRDVERLRSTARISGWICGHEHVSITAFASEATNVWDRRACPSMAKCDRLAASGRLRSSLYHPPGSGWPQKRWSAADLTRLVQRRRAAVIDVDAIEGRSVPSDPDPPPGGGDISM